MVPKDLNPLQIQTFSETTHFTVYYECLHTNSDVMLEQLQQRQQYAPCHCNSCYVYCYHYIVVGEGEGMVGVGVDLGKHLKSHDPQTRHAVEFILHHGLMSCKPVLTLLEHLTCSCQTSKQNSRTFKTTIFFFFFTPTFPQLFLTAFES